MPSLSLFYSGIIVVAVTDKVVIHHPHCPSFLGMQGQSLHFIILALCQRATAKHCPFLKNCTQSFLSSNSSIAGRSFRYLRHGQVHSGKRQLRGFILS
jgi:hypothetical protein